MMIQAGPKRRPAGGGYARGLETRLRIIQTAIPLFGRLGFESASTREIAAEAGVNPPALQYYFDSKEGLYRACAEYIAENASLAMDPSLRQAERLLREGAGPEALIEAYCRIVEDLAEHLFCGPDARTWAPLLAREQAGLGPQIAYPLLRERFIDRFNGVCARLFGKIARRSAKSPQILLRMVSLHGQLLSFQIGRASVLDIMGWSDISPANGESIKAVLVDHARMLLTAEHKAAAQRSLRDTSN